MVLSGDSATGRTLEQDHKQLKSTHILWVCVSVSLWSQPTSVSAARLMYTQIMRWCSGTHPDFSRRSATTLLLEAHQRDGTSYLTSLCWVYLLYLNTHTLPSLLCINSSTHASQNPSGTVLKQPETLSALADLNRFELWRIGSRFRRITLDAKCKAFLSHVVLNSKQG